MKFELKWSPDARDHLRDLPANQRAMAIDGAENHLKHQPDRPTKRRKWLRENSISTWELRLDNLRVFYNITGQIVEIVAVGVKEHNRLIIGGEEIEL